MASNQSAESLGDPIGQRSDSDLVTEDENESDHDLNDNDSNHDDNSSENSPSTSHVEDPQHNVKDLPTNEFENRQRKNMKNYNDEKMRKALIAVKAGMSVNKASYVYRVSKNTLMRRVAAFDGTNEFAIRQRKKTEIYREEDLKKALIAMKEGMSVNKASLMFNVSRSTIMRRVSTFDEAKIFEYLQRRKAVNYDTEDLREAISAIKEGMSRSKASMLYHIPKSTLNFRFRTLNNSTMGISSNESAKPTNKNSSFEVNYDLGDIVWAKVGGQPWWPAMLHDSPEDGIWIKRVAKRYKYHIQCFGPQMKWAWVSDNCLIPYEGHEGLEETLKQMRDLAPNDPNRQSHYELKVNPRLMLRWTASWREADEALPLANSTRLAQYGQICTDKPEKKRASLSLISSPREDVASKASKKKIPLPTKGNIVSPKHLTNESSTWSSSLVETPHSSLVLKLSLQEHNDLVNSGPASSPASEDIVSKEESLDNDSTSTSMTFGASKIQSTATKRRVSEPTSVKSDFVSPKRLKLNESKSDLPTTCNDLLERLDGATYEIQRLILSPSQYIHQPVCRKCGIIGKDMKRLRQCCGLCKMWFHPECVAASSGNSNNRGGSDVKDVRDVSEIFQCPDCCKNHRRCEICPWNEQIEDELIQCCTPQCNAMFHKKCLKQYPLAEWQTCTVSNEDEEVTKLQLKRCPMHFCWTCKLECPTTSKCYEGNFIHCNKCPMTFHSGDLCVPAGSIELSLSHIICPNHFVTKCSNDKSSNRVPHPPSCFKCFTSNPTVFCEYCPSAFHNDCVDSPLASPSTPNMFICRACRVHRPLRYGQIVWAKVGSYRWWPCEIVHAHNAPFNILSLAHKKGCFVCHFLGDDEYQWVPRSHAFPYELGREMPLGRIMAMNNSSSDENALVLTTFSKSVLRAKFIHQLYVNLARSRVPITSMSAPSLSGPLGNLLIECAKRAEKEKQEKEGQQDQEQEVKPVPRVRETKSSHNQSRFTFIQDNVPVGDVVVSHIDNSNWECECTADMDDPCTSRSKCQNVAMRVECHPSVCQVADQCGNQRFKKYLYPQMGVFETEKKGFGLKALQKITKNEFVCEFVGELITIKEGSHRLQELQSKNIVDIYMIKLDNNRVIDATSQCNMSRFINHSCSPNLEVQKWLVDGDCRIGLFALKDIVEDEELTFDYNLSMFGDKGMPCYCAAPNCRGFILKNINISSGHIVSSRRNKHDGIDATANAEAEADTFQTISRSKSKKRKSVTVDTVERTKNRRGMVKETASPSSEINKTSVVIEDPQTKVNSEDNATVEDLSRTVNSKSQPESIAEEFIASNDITDDPSPDPDTNPTTEVSCQPPNDHNHSDDVATFTREQQSKKDKDKIKFSTEVNEVSVLEESNISEPAPVEWEDTTLFISPRLCAVCRRTLSYKKFETNENANNLFMVRCAFCHTALHATCALTVEPNLLFNKINWLCMGWNFMCRKCCKYRSLMKNSHVKEQRKSKSCDGDGDVEIDCITTSVTPVC